MRMSDDGHILEDLSGSLAHTCAQCWQGDRCAEACTLCPLVHSSPSGFRPRYTAPATRMPSRINVEDQVVYLHTPRLDEPGTRGQRRRESFPRPNGPL